MANRKASAIDRLAKQYEELAQKAEAAEGDLGALRRRLIKEVLAWGYVPARATKTKALAGEEYELRVSLPLEVTVDTRTARRIEAACKAVSTNWRSVFNRLFRRVETYVLADGAQKLIDSQRLPVRAPRNLRSFFARAVRVRELAPQLEVRRREKKEDAV